MTKDSEAFLDIFFMILNRDASILGSKLYVACLLHNLVFTKWQTRCNSRKCTTLLSQFNSYDFFLVNLRLYNREFTRFKAVNLRLYSHNSTLLSRKCTTLKSRLKNNILFVNWP